MTKVTTTNDLASPEANALLLTGAPGESSNSSKSPTSGKEFLTVAFQRKNTGSGATTFTSPELKLVNAKGESYAPVTTSGYGGVAIPTRSSRASRLPSLPATRSRRAGPG